jgi:hypothetical protein
MNIFLATIIIILPIVKYKWCIITHHFQDPLYNRCNEPGSYLNNLVNYEYFNAMKTYCMKQIPHLNEKEL